MNHDLYRRPVMFTDLDEPIVCKGCGAAVFNPSQHDIWHRWLDALLAGEAKLTRLPEPQPDTEVSP